MDKGVGGIMSWCDDGGGWIGVVMVVWVRVMMVKVV